MQINVLDLEFECTEPYAAGQAISDVEARILNQARARGVGNSIKSEVKKFVDKVPGAKSQADLEELFAAADAKYVLTAPLDAVERQARQLARGIVRDSLADDGQKITDIPEGYTEESWEEQIDVWIDSILAGEHAQVIRDNAKTIVADRGKKVSVSLNELGIK